jgi:hypothetical protein
VSSGLTNATYPTRVDTHLWQGETGSLFPTRPAGAPPPLGQGVLHKFSHFEKTRPDWLDHTVPSYWKVLPGLQLRVACGRRATLPRTRAIWNLAAWAQLLHFQCLHKIYLVHPHH